MKYFLNMRSCRSVFAVPAEIVDNHIKLAGKEQIKTILWILRHSDKTFSNSEIALATGLGDDAVEDALSYWCENGIISCEGSENKAETADIPEKSEVPEIQIEQPKQRELPKKKRMQKPDGLYVATRMQESQEIKFLIEETEATLGKTISPSLASTLIFIHEDYGLPVEVIATIISYVKSVGKTSTVYIEAVAKDWAESGVFDLPAAENKLKELDERAMAWKKVESAVGIYHRAPSKKEEEFSHKWIYRWKFGSDMIKEAYDRCVDNTGKFAVSYINRILEKWHDLGYLTPEEVLAGEFRTGEADKTEKSYDLNEFEKLSLYNPPEE